MNPEKLDIYSKVTSRIIADLEKGVLPWTAPWKGGSVTRPRRHNGEPYKGINVLMLWGEALERGFASPIWMSYRQAQELGGQVRKGEKGALSVYADAIRKTETNEQGQDEERRIPFLKAYTVFNVDQIDGLPAHYYPQPEASLEPIAQRIEQAEQFFAATRADIRHGGNMAYYAIFQDYIQMPPFAAFKDAESHAATLLHELTHWTRHPSRLDRDLGHKRFGDEGYAREELVAELGAAFLCADLGITPETREDHAAYLGHWLTVLKGDKRAIFAAAAHAQRASDFLINLATPAKAAA